MKFGLVLPSSLGEPWGTGHAGDNYERTIRTAQLAEELGFDFAVFGHHRFSPGFVSAPFAVLSAIAAVTSRLRLGTNILILPLFSPLEIAEQVATLDRISNGRAFVGAGAGYRRHEFEATGLRYEDRGDRLTEAFEVLPRLWTEEGVSYAGAQFSFTDVTIYPRPVQRPHPPIWAGAQK